MKFILMILSILFYANISTADVQWTCVDPNTKIKLVISTLSDGSVAGEISNYLSAAIELSCTHSSWQVYDCVETRAGTDTFGAFLVLGDNADGGATGAVLQKDGFKQDGSPMPSKLIASFNHHSNCKEH